jgi:hypothetical protein
MVELLHTLPCWPSEHLNLFPFPNPDVHPPACLPVLTGGENGFNQAIELSAETLANVKFVQEKRLISR